VKEAVVAILPDAELILFGSRARGQAYTESDWDILILTERPVDYQLENRIRHALLKIELETGNVLPTLLETRSDWESPLNRVTPFFHEVSRDGVSLFKRSKN
jgi:predicted nucleotidyltransferase